jgi:hypothetical protein
MTSRSTSSLCLFCISKTRGVDLWPLNLFYKKGLYFVLPLWETYFEASLIEDLLDASKYCLSTSDSYWLSLC